MFLPAFSRAFFRATVVTVIASFSVTVFAVLPASSATAAQSPSTCSNSSLVNGSFENPLVAANTWALFSDSLVPGWSTTATDTKIEIWHAPFMGVPVPDGAQFAELNANQPSNLYQDVATTPGQTFRWQLQHRGRTGVDTMQVRIGAPGGALALQATIADGQTWGSYSGLYTVPSGQTTTRLSFDSIATSNGNLSYGNFLDAVSFTSGACVVTTKSVVNLSGASTVRLGDTLRYSVAVTNAGASNATLSTAIDALPTGISLVPGTLTRTDVTGTTPLTDAATDDAGEYDASSREVRVRVGDGSTSALGGTLVPGASTTVTFDVRVDSVTALPTVANTASVLFTDALTGSSSVSTSNTTSTTITPDAPALTIVTSATVNPLSHQGAAAVGDSIAWTYLVTNTGDVPLTGVTVNDPEGGTITCTPTTLAVGHSATCIGTSTHLVTDADLSVGSVVNGATALGTPPFGAAAVTSAESVATVQTAVPAPSIHISVSHVNTTSAGAQIVQGDKLRAQFIVTNTGNSTLDAITVVDPIFGSVTCVIATLAPGASTTCVANALYTVTAQDAATGRISRTVTATGASVGGAALLSVSAQHLATLGVVMASETSELAVTGSDAANAIALGLILLATGGAVIGAAQLQPRLRHRRVR